MPLPFIWLRICVRPFLPLAFFSGAVANVFWDADPGVGAAVGVARDGTVSLTLQAGHSMV